MTKNLRRSDAVAGFSISKSRDVLRVAAVVPTTEAEGPGRRFAIWSQGCSIRCSGCFNPHFWDAGGGAVVPVLELAEQVRQADVEGVTFLGGEPFEQAPAFANLARRVRALGVSVMVFSGYELEHLRGSAAPDGSAELLASTDLLVDGPYLADQIDVLRPWAGSSNQRFHFLTDRYVGLRAGMDLLRDRLEVRVSPDGEISINGWARVAAMDELLAGISTALRRGSVR